MYEQLSLEVDQVLKVLDFYNIKNVKRTGDSEINFSCPYPIHARGDKNPSAYINENSLVFHCFSCGAKGNIAHLVAELQGVSIAVAIRWLREGFHADFKAPDFSLLEEVNELFNKEKEERRKLLLIPEETTALFQVNWSKVYAAIESRDCPSDLSFAQRKYGFSRETLERAGIGFDTRSNRLTIPYRTPDNQLVGFKGRSTNGAFPKYLSIGDKDDVEKPYYGFTRNPLPNHVWGIERIEELGYKELPVIITEGEFDALKLRQWGYDNSVALGTSNMTENQKHQIIRNSDRVIIYFDPDEAGQKGARKVARSLLQYVQVAICEGHENDPADASLGEIHNTLNNTISSLTLK